jgi:hypothetical protein
MVSIINWHTTVTCKRWWICQLSCLDFTLGNPFFPLFPSHHLFFTMALTPIDIAFLEIAENFNKVEVFPSLPVLCSQCEWKITAKNREQIINFLNDVADKKKYEILEQNRDVLMEIRTLILELWWIFDSRSNWSHVLFLTIWCIYSPPDNSRYKFPAQPYQIILRKKSSPGEGRIFPWPCYFWAKILEHVVFAWVVSMVDEQSTIGATKSVRTPMGRVHESQGLKRWTAPTQPKDHDSRLL